MEWIKQGIFIEMSQLLMDDLCSADVNVGAPLEPINRAITANDSSQLLSDTPLLSPTSKFVYRGMKIVMAVLGPHAASCMLVTNVSKTLM